ncbi:hypothetical protein [Streptococcus sanguinis]|uniref:hypothetical protein n=1 Tax=Streptococcus sanguinis TaxID=1305 RepID=UPI001D151BC6|nr:hypothetical protein [Streptococcus sanguinis]MCC3172143.1 hypothetical protein [Streptococcus sanguinis]
MSSIDEPSQSNKSVNTKILNEDYFEELDKKLSRFKNLRTEAVELSKGIIGNNLFQKDQFFTSALGKLVDVLDGLSIMLRERNISCSGVLLRVQLDNLMRVFAAFISEDRKKFISSFLEGISINRLKDDDGKLMTDVRLRSRLALYCPKIDKVYKEMSGFVHLSDSAYEKTWWSIQDNGKNVAIGIPAREELNPKLLEIADSFIYFVEIEFELFDKVVASKIVADEELQNKSILNE